MVREYASQDNGSHCMRKPCYDKVYGRQKKSAAKKCGIKLRNHAEGRRYPVRWTFAVVYTRRTTMSKMLHGHQFQRAIMT